MRLVRLVVQTIVVLVTVYFIGRVFVVDSPTIVALAASLRPGPALWGLLATLGSTVVVNVLWVAIVAPHKPFDRALNLVFAKANLIRYIPGNVFGLGARVVFAAQSGIGKLKGIASIVVEGVLLLASTGTLAFLFLLPAMTPVVAAGAVIVIWLLARQARFAPFVPPPRIAAALSLGYALYGLLLGLATAAFAESVNVDVPLSVAIGVFNLAWFLGYASLITPSGLGVREGTMILFLAPLIGLPEATFLTVASRLAIVVSDLAVAGFLWGIAKRAHTSPLGPA